MSRASESARRRRAVPLHRRSRRRTGNARAHGAPPRTGRAADRLARLGAPREEEPADAPRGAGGRVRDRRAAAGAVGEPAGFDRDDSRRVAPPRPPGSGRPAGSRSAGADRRPSGREKHDEKITVYCSAEELFELERARLALRGDHGMVVDRGRIVREAVAVVLADLDAKGESCILVRRLRGR